MKKCSKKIGVLLTITLVLVSISQCIATTSVIADTVDSSSFSEKTLLSNSEVESLWPNLPTAEELWKNDIKFVIDTNTCGKRFVDPQFADDASLADVHVALDILNYTTDQMNYLTGEMMYNVPHIWLQYNDTTWIHVPKSVRS